MWLIKTHKFFIWQVENKPFKASVLRMNDSRIHRNIRIARDDNTVTLGCSDWCGLPLNASERVSEQTLIFSLEGRPMYFLRLASLRWPKIVMMSSPRWTSAWLVWILTVISVWLYFHHSCFVLFCFWSQNFTYYLCVSCICLIFITVYKLAI